VSETTKDPSSCNETSGGEAPGVVEREIIQRATHTQDVEVEALRIRYIQKMRRPDVE
jgi:hypothetical protein